MAERGAASPRDGIVVIELALEGESGWEIPALVGCIRAGADALAQMPYRGSNVTGVLHATDVARIGHKIGDEIEAAAREVQAALVQFHRDADKADKKRKR